MFYQGDESYDDFDENGHDLEHMPPPSRSVGQGGFGSLSAAEQAALLEKRKQLK